MVGICVVTHGELASGFKDSCELIIGAQEYFSTVGLRLSDDFNEFKENVFQSIISVNTGSGVLVLVDLFGASPYNAVLFNHPKFKELNIDVCMISGVNLAMIIEACEQRTHRNLNEVFTKAIKTGKEYIIGVDGEMNQVI